MIWVYLSFVGMQFVPNLGQAPKGILFYNGYTYVLKNGDIYIKGVKIKLGEAPRIEADMPSGSVSFFSDRRSRTLPVYRRLIFRDVYPNVDAIFTAGSDHFELQFVVKPGGDPSSITLRCEGGTFTVEEGAAYVVKGGHKVLKFANMRAFQGSEEVALFPFVKEGSLRFRVGEYDPRHTLVIDPVVSVILSGTAEDRIEDVIRSPDGTVYVVGYTSSPDFAPSRNEFGSDGLYDVFVTRLSSDLSTHLATAIVSGSGNDYGKAVSILPGGEVAVVGYTDNSTDFAPSRTVMGTSGGYDAFITILSPDLGTHLSTAIITGPGNDLAYDIAVTPVGNLVIAGVTFSPSAFAPSRRIFGDTGIADVFITKVSGDLSSHIATAIIGGTGRDDHPAVKIGPAGNVLITGYTDFPNNFAPSRIIIGDTGRNDIFVTELSRHLTTHIATVILASDSNDYAYDLAVSSEGVYVIGTTYGYPNFAGGGGRTFGIHGMSDAFITLIDSSLSSVLSLTFLSGSDYDHAKALALSGGRVVVAGYTRNSSDFSTSRTVHGTPGNFDVFVTELSTDLATHINTSIFASNLYDYGEGVYIDSPYIYVVGFTYADTLFAGHSSYMGSLGNWNSFIVRMDMVTVSVEEKPEVSNYVVVRSGEVKIRTESDGYVGYDIYDESGRLLYRESLGYLPRGGYTLNLPSLPRGTYVLKIRAAKALRSINLIF